MNYFIAMNLGQNITGIESSQIKRLRLFKERNLPAKCVYTTFNLNLYQNAQKYDLQNNYLSMYDFFQECENYREGAFFDWLRFWENDCSFRIKRVTDTSDVRIVNQNNQLLMYAHFEDTTYKQLVYINYFDSVRKVKRDHFDCRGFLSRTTFLGDNQRVQVECYYTPSGKLALEKYYERVDDQYGVTKIFLKNYKGRDYFFNTEAALQTFFFNELYEVGDVYFCDRNRHLAEPLLKVKERIPICAVLHSTHTLNSNDPLHSNLTRPYKNVLTNSARFEKIIVSTNQQREELEERFPEAQNFITIPVGYCSNEKSSFSEKKENKLIGVARYSEEKQVAHQIRLIKKIVPDFPNITLHLYGFGNEKGALEKMIIEEQLENHVFLKGFRKDLSHAYATSVLSLLTSRVEGFSLALLEAQAQGVPSASYDVRYGPREIIDNEINGYLIEKNNEEALYKKVKAFLNDQATQKFMEENTQILIKRYSKEVVGEKWEEVLSQIS